MNLYGQVQSVLLNPWLLLPMLVVALAAMILPHRAMTLRSRYPVEGAITLSPFLYFIMLGMSLTIQARTPGLPISFAVAAFSSLVVTPFLGFVALELLGVLLK